MSNVIDTSLFPPLDLPPFKMVQPITARYKPLPDITAWELAQILPGLLGKPIYEEQWQALGTATRHLERLDQEAPPIVT
jgi:hypothetical protein